MIFRWCALLIGTLLVTAQAISEPLPLVGTTWRWIGAHGVPMAQDLDVPSPSHYSLELGADGRYAVRADCNRGQGTYASQGDGIRFAPGPMTLAECGPQSFANHFLELLSQVSEMRQAGDRLTLTVAEQGGVMEFEGRQPITLAGTTWLVRAYNNGKEAVVSILKGSTVTAAFAKDGAISGLAGCNRYSAGYHVTADKITIGPARTTRKACRDPEGVMEQESRFLAALEAAGVYQIDGERLQLRADNGSLLVDLVSAVAGVLKMPEGATLPPDASVRIQIQNVSLADAPAKIIGEQILSSTGTEATAGFEVEFDPAVIDPDDSYTVSARVTDPEDKLLFVSTSSHPVITRGSPQLNVSVDLEAAR